ncbi:MAG: GFA family protein [Xanthomonadales bacterium]|nr:GFA family protein [Gammaproteobacteria bacterium]MBT8053902.1 GFA family protein [Gammaproteobacteria bacterium]NND55985.1 GFA family protein [Xanthomonadales bacterium]NNK52046.1 GFA family protein [Xanthomonadales bacterium]
MSGSECVSGGCLCGAVRFEARLPSKWCAHCHCSMCRRAHGAGFVTWVGFESDHFLLKTGDHHLQWYESSPGARRGFCSTCGSTMLFESSRWPGETHVALGSIEDPIDRKPQANSFFDDHVDWAPIDEALKAYNG